MPKQKILFLSVKKKYFEMIKQGIKTEEYRELNNYWFKKLVNKNYDEIIISLGYPKKNDISKRISFKYEGYTLGNIKHEEWNYENKRVFAIKLQN